MLLQRRISRDDLQALKADRKWGNDKEDYATIAERVMGERVTSSAVEVLQEPQAAPEAQEASALPVLRLPSARSAARHVAGGLVLVVRGEG